MSHYIIDRRTNGRNKSAPNRKKLLDRVKGAVRQTVRDAVRDGGVTDIVRGGKKVSVPIRDLSEPQIVHGEGGVVERTIPGNKNYKLSPGDRIERQKSGGGKGSKGSDSGDGEDEFTFELTRDEFLEYFFEDLELPDLARKKLAITEEKKPIRSGFAQDGNPSNLDLLHTMKSSVGRRAALRTPKKKKLRELEANLEALNTADTFGWGDNDILDWKKQVAELEEQIETIKRKIRAVPYIDDVDLRFRNWTSKPVPATKAVMFCLMDVSGSMGQWNKDIAKRFYMLLYLFLFNHYEKVEIVYVRHHHDAEEVDENDFFYNRASGGTIVSKGLQLVNNIIEDRYSTHQWNVYVAQASDGDNWSDDNAETMKALNTILSKIQYYFYVDIRSDDNSELWELYTNEVHARNFDMQRITDVSEIYPVFRKLFEAR